MTIPDKIKIGGYIITVQYPYVFKERSDMRGQYDDTINLIRLSKYDAGGQQRANSSVIVTLLHEILHGIDIQSGHIMFEGDRGEGYIEAISHGIYQVLVDNPQLLELFREVL